MSVTPGDSVQFVDYPGRSTGNPLRDRGASSSLRIARLVREPRRNAHRHPHTEEVVYVKQGKGSVYIDGVFHPVAPGDTVHIPRNAIHATVPDAGERMELICFFPHPDLGENIEETEIDVMKELDDD